VNCIYKHEPGQKREKGPFKNKTLVLNGGEQKDHVSERKFVENEGEEELITPGNQIESMDSDIQITT